MTEIKISLPPKAYQQWQRWATMNGQDVATLMAEYLRQAAPTSTDELPMPPAEPNTAVESERIAYERLLPTLQQTHAGQFVAIHGGELVDADMDEAALFARIDNRYPQAFVWLAQVGMETEPEFVLRTPRLSLDE